VIQMKTLTTLAATLLAVFLTLAPTVAFAATTITVATDAASYQGAATIHVTGTVSPAPSANTAVLITTKGPRGAVDYGAPAVSTSTGAYSYTFVAGGGGNWVTGTYTVNATWGASSGTAPVFATTTFQYTSAGPSGAGGGGGGNNVLVQVLATSPAYAGQTIQIAVLTESSINGSLAAATFTTVHYHTPQGTLVTLGTPTTIHKGFYFWTVQLPANASDGTYFVHAWVNNNNIQGQGLGSFTVNSAIASSSSVSALQKSVSDLSAAVQTISTGLTGVQSAANDAKTAAGNALTAVNGLASAVTGVQSTVNTINSGVQSLSGLSGLSAQMSSLSSAVSNSQTYVLVVAALAAITLVLELAILVRKLS
jgi:hypothetical protein